MTATLSKSKFGPWALVTGASSGIGKEFAQQLAANHFNLVLVSRRSQHLEDLGQDLGNKYGIRYQVIVADLAQKNGFQLILQEIGTLDIGLVVSNAGTGSPGEFVHKAMDDLLETVNTSVLAHLKITHHFAGKFVKRESGGIILVSAMGAKNGLPFMAHDAGTRAYIRSLGLGLHLELKRHGVYLTVLETTPTNTPLVTKLGFNPDRMPINPISTEQCVEETLSAFRKNRPIILPGRFFRILTKLVPPSYMRKRNGRMLADGNQIKWVL